MTERAIVTGAGRGIGRGIARVFAQAGGRVGVLSRTESELVSLVDEIVAEGGQAVYRVCDLRSWDETERAISELIGELDGLDALVNNAGRVLRGDITEIEVEEWTDLFATNVHGLFYATRAALPTLRTQQSGHIFNVSSISGRLPLAGGSAYAASKYAVTGFSESLFHEVRNDGIKVTTVFPGSVAPSTGADDWKVTPEEVGEACLSALRTAPHNCVSRIEIRPLQPPR